MERINANAANRKTLREHAREAMAAYSPVMTWVLLSREGELSILTEPQGQSEYVGSDRIIAKTGGFHKAHGGGAANDPRSGRAYATQRAYLTDLLGAEEYSRIFPSTGGQ